MSQLFWYALQFGAGIGGGFLLATIFELCCYESGYMNAPKFYKIAFAIGFVLFALPTTLAISAFLDWRRRKSESAYIDSVLLEPLDNSVSRRALGDSVSRLPKDI